MVCYYIGEAVDGVKAPRLLTNNATIDCVPMDRVPRDPSFLIDLRLSTFCIEGGF